MKKITVTLKSRIENKVANILCDYGAFRNSLASNASEGISIKNALEEEDVWEAKIRAAKKPLKGATVFAPVIQNEIVRLGSPVTLLYPDGTSKDVIVDGADYKDEDVTIISRYSKIGAQLMGKKINETVVIHNQETKIVKIWYPW